METGGKSPPADRDARADRHEDLKQQAKRSQQANRKSVGNSPDAAEPSARSREMQNLGKLIESTPDVRTALVARFRRAIENGTYNVNSKKLAERLLGCKLFD